MWGYVQKRARREKLCPQYRVSGPLTFRSHYSGAQWSYLNRDPMWRPHGVHASTSRDLASFTRVSREPISTAFTQLSPYFMIPTKTGGGKSPENGRLITCTSCLLRLALSCQFANDVFVFKAHPSYRLTPTERTQQRLVSTRGAVSNSSNFD